MPVILYIYKECGSLHSPTPCLCIDFICVSTAWKVTACMVHQSQSVYSMNNKQWFKGQVYCFTALYCTHAQSRSRDLTSLTT